MLIDTCDRCKFKGFKNPHTEKSPCYRYPPHVVHGWPSVRDMEACGEFQPINTKAKAKET